VAGQFELALSQFAAKAGDRADQVVRQVTLEVASRIIVRSPVDTGRFRGNWRLGVGGPVSGTTELTDRDGGATNGAIAAALPAKAAGTVLYLTNNLPYAWALEHGHSKLQAPNGMVALTVLEFAAIVDKAAGGLAP
jgi:hypothetical protein